MLPYRDSRLTRIALAILFVIVAGYAYFETRGLLYGPKIIIPPGVSQVEEQFILLTGRAERIATLKMNGHPISVTEDGTFEEPYLLSPGLNRVIFDAEDKYGNTSQKVLQIVYTAPEGGPYPVQPPSTTTPITLPDATSTATTTP